MSAVHVHHVVEGPPDAPPLLLLNSLGSTLAMWDEVMPHLVSRFRVVRMDTRGHGFSPVPPGPYEIGDLVDDAVTLLDRLAVSRTHVVGLSLGGMTAMQLAARHPDRVDRLAVLCTSALLGPPQSWADRAAAVRADGTSSIAAAVVSRWVTPATAASRPDVVVRLEAMVAGTSDAGYAACCGAIERMDLRDDLPRIVAPTLAVAGADDPATPPEHLSAIASSVRGARLAIVPQAAHLAAVERPDEVAALLMAHLRDDETET